MELARKMMNESPGQWIQLWGHAEAGAIGGPRMKTWKPETQLGLLAMDELHYWWTKPLAYLAVALPVAGLGNVVITHAGITKAVWEALESPSAHDTALKLNRTLGHFPERVFRAGYQLYGESDPLVSPVWTDLNSELYPSWWNEVTPFTQIHSHLSPWWWEEKQWTPGLDPKYQERCIVDKKVRQTMTKMGDADFSRPGVALCIDWGLEVASKEENFIPLELNVDDRFSPKSQL